MAGHRRELRTLTSSPCTHTSVLSVEAAHRMHARAPVQGASSHPPGSQEAQLSLFRNPLRTLYWFGRFAGSGLATSARFCASHPITLFLVLPALALYGAAKHFGSAPEAIALLEVRSAWPALLHERARPFISPASRRAAERRACAHASAVPRTRRIHTPVGLHSPAPLPVSAHNLDLSPYCQAVSSATSCALGCLEQAGCHPHRSASHSHARLAHPSIPAPGRSGPST